MLTSQQWWDQVKNDSKAFTEWLLKQYRGEVTAATRIRAITQEYPLEPYQERILNSIANDEELHASWVAILLKNRGIEVVAGTENAELRYWASVRESIEDFTTACGVAAHAEAMRLERIRVICEDAETPDDVRWMFKQILKDEVYHERAFSKLAGQEAMAKTVGSHEVGKKVLGLVI